MDILEQQGNIYLYLLGILDSKTGGISVEAVDSLQYDEDEFIEKVNMLRDENLDLIEGTDDALELFCIIGVSKKS